MVLMRIPIVSLSLAGAAATQETCSARADAGMIRCVRHADPALGDGVRWCIEIGGCANRGGSRRTATRGLPTRR